MNQMLINKLSLKIHCILYQNMIQYKIKKALLSTICKKENKAHAVLLLFCCDDEEMEQHACMDRY